MFVDCCVGGGRYFQYYSYRRNPTGWELFVPAGTLIAVKLLIILAMTGAFWGYPICRGPLDKSGLGSGHATTRAQAMLQLAIYELQYVYNILL
jgi:hypothetical protein